MSVNTTVESGSSENRTSSNEPGETSWFKKRMIKNFYQPIGMMTMADVLEAGGIVAGSVALVGGVIYLIEEVAVRQDWVEEGLLFHKNNKKR